MTAAESSTKQGDRANNRRYSRRYNRGYWIAGVLIVLMLGFFLLVGAPASNRIDTGSTWGTAPDGYGAWYAYMEAEGANIKRWQRPIAELVQAEKDPQASPRTLVRIIPPAFAQREDILGQSEISDWLAQGNRLVILTQRGAVTAAKFSSQLDSEAGKIAIETRRRYRPQEIELPSYEQEGTEISYKPTVEPLTNRRSTLAQSQPAPSNQIETLLADDYGTVVWRSLAEPNLVWAITPFLAANAYQSAPGNFAFLSNLVQPGAIWVDEYLHGYRDRDVVVKEVAGTWLGYLAKTPLLIAAVQIGVVLLIALIAQNRRAGSKQPLPFEPVNNSEAYIKALAGVLHKANNRDFLIETLVGAEQKALARSLGLGEAAVSLEALQVAWQQKTGRSIGELDVLQAKPKGEAALQAWLQQLQSLVPKASQKASSKASSRASSKS